MFQLGLIYKDKITDFEGVATGHVRYLTGCNQVLITPKIDKEGKPREAQWFDEQRLVQQPSESITLDNSKSPGFDKQPPKY
jgi:hypothetical protein